MFTGKKILGLITLVYLALVAAFVVADIGAAWGINHFAFLPPLAVILIAALFIIGFISLFSTNETKLLRIAETTHDYIWGSSLRGSSLRGSPIWGPLSIAGTFMFLCYFFKTDTHFLGDGYTWLSIFGGGEGYIPKWSEYGAIQILRVLQYLSGEYTQESALIAFRIMSVASGGLAIIGAVMLLRALVTDKIARLMGLVLLLSSGQALLFFGYVEFYPVSWAVTLLFFAVAVNQAMTKRGSVLIILLFLLALIIHVQVIYFLPALLWLLIATHAPDRFKKALYAILLVLCAAGAVLIVYLVKTRVEIEVLFMPLFQGRPNAPGYYFLSIPHLSDILQQTLLIIPALPILIWMTARNFSIVRRDRASQFLLLCSAGSISFLFLFGAVLTRARDWDIFSLCLLAPILLIIRLTTGEKRVVYVHYAFASCLVTLLMTTGYLTANLHVESPEQRYYSILRYYESHDHSSWATLATHYKNKGDIASYDRIAAEMNELFPEYVQLQKAYSHLTEGRPDRALPIAIELAESDPYNREFLKVAGSAYSKLGNYDLAEPYYDRAHRLGPYLSTLKNEIGQMYLAQQRYDEALEIFKEARHLSPNKTFIAEGVGLAYYRLDYYDSTLAVADSLFEGDPNSPGAHLLSMVVAISSNRLERARYHYNEFLRYGLHRSDYTRIRDSYAYLSE